MLGDNEIWAPGGVVQVGGGDGLKRPACESKYLLQLLS
jgi:hypothetical protein